MYSLLTAVEYLSQMKQFVPIVNAKFSFLLILIMRQLRDI